MGAMVSQMINLAIVYAAVYLGADQRKHQSSALLAFVRGIRRWTMNSPHKGPTTRKMFPFDDVIMICEIKMNYLHAAYLLKRMVPYRRTKVQIVCFFM